MPSPLFRSHTNAGHVAAGCKLYTYEAGTTTPKQTFQDAAGLVPHENPITLDSKGEALIYWDGSYRIDLKTDKGAQISGYPVDNFTTPAMRTERPVQSETQTATEGQTVFNLTGIAYTPGIGSLHVYLNGLRLSGGDYTETGAAKVTFARGLTAGDEVLFEAGSGVNSQSANDAAMIPFAASLGISRSVQNKFRDALTVKDFGALGDGIADDSAAIAAAFAAGVGYFPAGTYLHSGIFINGMSQVRICGESKHNTTLKLLAGSNTHCLAYAAATSCSVHNITLDQNRTGQTGGHGIRLGGIDGLTVSDVRIINCYSYGIGMQAGANKNVFISLFEIDNTGQDGIDIKDYLLGNANIIIDDGIITNYGDNALGQPAVDVRGPAIVRNIQAVAQNPENRVIRYRGSGVQGRAGSGVFSGIQAVITGSAAYCIETSADSAQYAISDVICDGGWLGVIRGTSGQLSNISGVNLTGNTEALSIFAQNTHIKGLVIDGCARGVDMEAGATGNTIQNFLIKNVSGAEAVRNGADDNTFISGEIQAGKLLDGAGLNPTIRDVRNWKTRANLVSGDLLVDTTATRTFVVVHGLPFTPNAEDITLTVVRSTGNPSDYRIGLLHIEAITSSQFVARVVITTASATAGAAVKLAVSIRSKNS